MHVKQFEAISGGLARQASADNADKAGKRSKVKNSKAQSIAVQTSEVKKPRAKSIPMHVSIANPFAQGPHIEAMLKRNIVLAPLVLHWRYRVAEAEHFLDWLTTRDIVLSGSRLSADQAMCDVRYGGTYVLSQSVLDSSKSARNDQQCGLHKGEMCLTVWGIRSKSALDFLNALFGGEISQRSIVQNDALQFVTELRTFIVTPRSRNFSEEVLVSASTHSSTPQVT